MIVGERKPFNDIKESVKNYKKVMILGCGTCVAVCMSGGEKEVELTSTELRMANKLDGREQEIITDTIQRQCDKEYIEPIVEKAKSCDAVLSMACGAGVQWLADAIEPVPVIPALNTRFIGVAEGEGQWSERCRACGECVLGDYGGICPVTMCAKGLLNGPCGGTKQGKCESGNGNDCAWVLIYNRLKKQNKLDNLKSLRLPRDSAKRAHPAHYINEAYLKPEMATLENKDKK